MNTELYNGMGYHAGAWEPECRIYTDCPDLLRRYGVKKYPKFPNIFIYGTLVASS